MIAVLMKHSFNGFERICRVRFILVTGVITETYHYHEPWTIPFIRMTVKLLSVAGYYF